MSLGCKAVLLKNLSIIWDIGIAMVDQDLQTLLLISDKGLLRPRFRFHSARRDASLYGLPYLTDGGSLSATS